MMAENRQGITAGSKPALAPMDEAVGPARMPTDLKERGWKLESRRVNDDDETYVARNEQRGLETEPFPVPATAIAAARKLDNNGTPLLSGPIIKPVSLLQIRTDGGTQPRSELDQATVERFADDMAAGQYPKFPPVIVFHDGSDYWLADGFHRLFAYRKAFGDSPAPGMMNSWAITADVRQGTQRDAILYSLGANATHGLPRSNADKRRAVLTLLEDPEWSKWSDNVIAGKAKVSQPFVSSLRRDLTQNVLSDRPAVDDNLDATQRVERADLSPRPTDRPGQIETAPQPQPTKRIGADGVARETTNIGRKTEEPKSDAIKVTDKRRFADGPTPDGKTKAVAELLNGRKLAVSYVWIPGVAGKVLVSVNAGKKPQNASRELIAAGVLPAFPAPVLNLITQQLSTAPSATSSKKPAARRAKKVARKLTTKNQRTGYLKAQKKANSRKIARKK